VRFRAATSAKPPDQHNSTHNRFYSRLRELQSNQNKVLEVWNNKLGEHQQLTKLQSFGELQTKNKALEQLTNK
jgi:hypothetical protein